MNLDKKSRKILHYFTKSNSILTLDQLLVLTQLKKEDIVERLVYLWKKELIRIVAHEQPEYLPLDGRFQITMEGKIYNEQRLKTFILTWAPIVISIIAIIISIIALIRT